jgi:hypothetical protein
MLSRCRQVSGLADEEEAPVGGDPDGSLGDLMDTIRQLEVSQLLLTTVTTLLSVAYGKLEARDLGQAKTAIEAVKALLGVLTGGVDGELRRDLEQALANLQVAYADAVASAE